MHAELRVRVRFISQNTRTHTHKHARLIFTYTMPALESDPLFTHPCVPRVGEDLVACMTRCNAPRLAAERRQQLEDERPSRELYDAC